MKHALSIPSVAPHCFASVLVAMMTSMVAAGCAEEAPGAAAPPEAVAPVEVTQAVTAPEGEEDELTTLRARVAELEQQLASCQTAAAPAPSGTQAVAIPEGADVPAEGATPTAQNTRPDAGARARRERDPSLLETILGPDGRRRRRTNDDTIELPNPANVLLGN